ncbi:MAG: DNA topoisomerase 3 [Pseudomonadota bacterium]
MKRLIVAEKPSVARDLAKIIGAKSKRDGFLEGNGNIVSWTIGHLCDIAPPDAQNEQWTKWRLESLPMIPEKFRLSVLPDTKKQFMVLRKLMNDPEVTDLVEATDAGREGELIFRRVYQMSKCKKPIKRLWLSSLTDEAIKRAFENILPGTEFNKLAAAAYARAESDWLVGMNETRAFTIKCGGELLTVGRVQTPVLAMLVKRRLEINNFTPQPFWEITAFFSREETDFKALWHQPPDFKNTRLLEKNQADEIFAKCVGRSAQVESASQKKGSSQPPLLFDLTSLQRACNAKFGFPAKKTLGLAQDLYEKQKIITYPRTDSQYIPPDLFAGIASHFKAIRDHYPDVIVQLRGCFEQNPKKYRVVNEKKVTDHHAIIPTTKTAIPASLPQEQRQVYDLVCRRFLAAFLPAAEYFSTEAWLVINGEKFKASGKVFKKLGWMEAEPWAVRDENPLPRLEKGQIIEPNDLKLEEKTTKPPPHFSDATLLRAMETAGKLVEDEELAQAMKDRGLGTPATRAQTIEALLEKKRGYAERVGKAIVATDKGVEAVRIIKELLPEAVSPELTGEWEYNLKQVEQGGLTYQDFMNKIRTYVQESIERVKLAQIKFHSTQPRPTAESPAGKSQAQPLGKCPLCGGDVVETAKAYGCSNWRTSNCKFTIWKNSFGGRITPSAVTELLNNGRTTQILTLTSPKTKKDYQARLKLEDGKVSPYFGV